MSPLPKFAHLNSNKDLVPQIRSPKPIDKHRFVLQKAMIKSRLHFCLFELSNWQIPIRSFIKKIVELSQIRSPQHSMNVAISWVRVLKVEIKRETHIHSLELPLKLT